MKPLSDFTTPRKLMAPISRHFLPVEQPEPFCCTTGLKKGSRFPLIAHFLSSLGLAASAALAGSAAAGFSAGTAAAAVLFWSLAGFAAAVVGFAPLALAVSVFVAGFAATRADFEVVATAGFGVGAGLLLATVCTAAAGAAGFPAPVLASTSGCRWETSFSPVPGVNS